MSSPESAKRPDNQSFFDAMTEGIIKKAQLIEQELSEARVRWEQTDQEMAGNKAT